MSSFPVTGLDKKAWSGESAAGPALGGVTLNMSLDSVLQNNSVDDYTAPSPPSPSMIEVRGGGH